MEIFGHAQLDAPSLMCSWYHTVVIHRQTKRDRQKAGMYHRAYNNRYHTIPYYLPSLLTCAVTSFIFLMTESGSIRSVHIIVLCLNMNMAWYVVRYSFHGLHNQLIFNFHSSTWRGCVWCEGENLWRPEEVGRAVSDHSKSSNAIWLVVLVEFHIEDGQTRLSSRNH